MAIKRMKKIDLLVHQYRREELFHLLQDMGVLQITEQDPPNETLNSRSEVHVEELERQLSEVRFCLDFIHKYRDEKPSPLESLFPIPLEVEKSRFLHPGFNYESVHHECTRIEEEINRVRTSLNRLYAHRDFLHRIETAEVPLEDLGHTQHTRALLVEVNPEQLSELKEELGTSGDSWVVEEFPAQKRIRLVLVIVHEELLQTLETFIHEHSITVISLPQAFEGTPRQAREGIQQKIISLEKAREKFVAQAAAFRKFENDFKITHDVLESHLERRITQSKLLWTDSTCLLNGWAREEDLPRIQEALGSRWKEWMLFSRDPLPDEIVPIELENTKWVDNFKILTHLYGLPNYSEVDPTPLVAFFFFLFFGIAVGDVIYGIVMAIAGFTASALLLKFPDSSRAFFRMLAWCGIGSIIVGTLTGSWLGDFFEYLPPALGFLNNLRESIMVINPLVDPLPMLVFSIGLGVFQVLVGILVGFVKEWRRKNYTVAILDNFSWFLFILSILSYLAAVTMAPAYETPALGFLIAMVLFLVATQGRAKQNPIMKILSGILSLYGLVNYLGDVLSYSRLFALGLATTIVAILARTLAELFGGAPYIGWLIALVVFLLFHLFNIAISGLGAFVHSARLQYVEFFTKFYESGGKEFKPFSYKSKYTKLI